MASLSSHQTKRRKETIPVGRTAKMAVRTPLSMRPGGPKSARLALCCWWDVLMFLEWFHACPKVVAQLVWASYWPQLCEGCICFAVQSSMLRDAEVIEIMQTRSQSLDEFRGNSECKMPCKKCHRKLLASILSWSKSFVLVLILINSSSSSSSSSMIISIIHIPSLPSVASTAAAYAVHDLKCDQRYQSSITVQLPSIDALWNPVCGRWAFVLSSKQSIPVVYLKSNFEFLRGNYRKAIKVLNSAPPPDSSTKGVEGCIPVMYYNNMAVIHFYMRKHNLGAFYLRKAIEENHLAVKSDGKSGEEATMIVNGKKYRNSFYKLQLVYTIKKNQPTLAVWNMVCTPF